MCCSVLSPHVVIVGFNIHCCFSLYSMLQGPAASSFLNIAIQTERQVVC